MDHGAARLIVDDARQAQAGGRVDDGEIGTDLIQPLVQHVRHHRGGAVVGVAVWRVQKPGIETRRRRRSSTLSVRESRVTAIAARKPSAALSPPTLRICSAKTGSYSTQCPSPSIMGV